MSDLSYAMLSGQDTKLQLGISSTWGTPTGATLRLPYLNESFTFVPNYKEQEALVGKKTVSGMDIMSKKASGGFSTYIGPDEIGVLLYLCLGSEATPTTPGGTLPRNHVFTPLASGRDNYFPSATIEIDRLNEAARYVTMKVADWSLSAQVEDYLTLQINWIGYGEDSDEVVTSGTSATATGTSVVIDSVAADNDYVGNVLVSGGEARLIVSSTAADDTVVVETAFSSAPSAAAYEIYEFYMTTGLTLSTKEYFQFRHGELTFDDLQGVDGAISGTGTGIATETFTVTSGKTTGFETRGVTTAGKDVVFSYIGSAITNTGTTLTFTASAAGDGEINPIYDGSGDFNSSDWEIKERVYEEVTSVTLNGNNSLQDNKFGMNGSYHMVEINPQKRMYTVSANAEFTSNLAALRKRRFKKGTTVSITLEFETDELIETGWPYSLKFELPTVYITSVPPNIDGPDAIDVSFEGTASEGTEEAITATVRDGRSTKWSA